MPLSRRLCSLLDSTTLLGGSRCSGVPIGQARVSYLISKQCLSSFTSVEKKTFKKRDRCVSLSAASRRRLGGSRTHSSQRQPYIASEAKRSNTAPLLGVVLGASAITYLASTFTSTLKPRDDAHESVDGVDITTDGTDEDDADHKIRLVDVPKHDRDAATKWVIKGTSVYDITDFVEQHPGGEIVLRACGGSIDPYWKLFNIHDKPEVHEILSKYHIGEIDERDLDSTGRIDWSVLGELANDNDIDDPFKHEPARDDALIIRTDQPCNAETPGKLLVDFLTPLRLFFVRNHLWVPRVEESPHAITIELSDGEEKTFTLSDLKRDFKQYTITATLQCSGNRRSHMSQASQGKTSGLAWDIGAIGTAEFSGVKLHDVLRAAGHDMDDECPAPSQSDCEDEDKHVHFSSPCDTYAVSIPLQTALNPQADVLLAWDMNGEPIDRDHGGPLRAIVPGTTAARSVKWLGRVIVSSDEASGQYQRKDYKCFGPNIKQADVTIADWDAAQAIQESPVQSAITNILRDTSDSKTFVQGFAFSGGGRNIVRVDVSADGGRTWRQAQLSKDKAKGSKRWAWTLWSIDWAPVDLTSDQEVEFVVKATDDSYNTQPESFDSTWNFRGVCANAWHRVRPGNNTA